MRIWSIHPKYLDGIGLIACFRESLLAQKVLEGKTKGYKNHPQLIRFKESSDSLLYIGAYLLEICVEAKKRGYNFDSNKILYFKEGYSFDKLTVTKKQIEYEFKHLLNKLSSRNPEKYKEIKDFSEIETNNIFVITEGEIEPWEKI